MKEILITSSVLILAVVGLRLLFQKKVSRRLIYCAWLLVALRLLVPVQFGNVNFSILTPAQPVTDAIGQVAQTPVAGPSREEVYDSALRDYMTQERPIFRPEVQEQVDTQLQQGRPVEDVYDEVLESNAPENILLPEVKEEIETQVAEIVKPTLGQIATVIWVIGMVAMAAWFVGVNVAFYRKLGRNATDLELPECKTPVKVSSAVASPCLFGLLRPTIYLTPGCVSDEKKRHHVLTHELTHLRSGDHIWAWVRCICLCIYWFNPLVWLAAGLSKRDCELACDETALKQLGEEERLAYGKTLLDMVSSVPAPGQLLQTATAMHETKKQLKERMTCIVKKPKVFLTAAILLLAVLALVTGCAFTGAFDSVTEPPKTTTPTTTPTTTATTGPKQLKDMTDYELLWEMAANQRMHNMMLSSAYVSDSEVVALMAFSPEFAELMTRETAADSIRDYALEIEKQFYAPQGGVIKLLDMLSEIEEYLAEKFDPSILDDPEIQKFNALFQPILAADGKSANYYNWGVGEMQEYASVTQLSLRSLFDYGFYDEMTPTDAELTELKQHFKEVFMEIATFYRLPKDKMNAVLQTYFGITLADLPDTAFEFLTYLESTDCYYFYSMETMNMAEGFEARRVEHLSDGTIKLTYRKSGVQSGDFVVVLKPNGDSYQLLSNVYVKSQSSTAPDPTEPTTPTVLGVEQFQELLRYKTARNPYYYALLREFSDPREIELRYFFKDGFGGGDQPTDAEMAVLKEHYSDYMITNGRFFRLPKDRMNEELQRYFGITLADLPDSAFMRVVYLESSDSYGFLDDTPNMRADDITVVQVEYRSDGTIRVEYTGVVDGKCVVILKADGDHYRILSNEWYVYDDPLMAEIAELFEPIPITDPGRRSYFWATGHTYINPLELSLYAFYDGGFQGEHEMTEAEREALKQIVLWTDWVDMADFNRLPKDKMDAELQKVFGITLADLPDSAFERLYYLESTDCYYLLQTGMTCTPSGTFTSATANDDGTVTLTYNLPGGSGAITLKPNGDGWLVVSNIQDMLYG